MCAIRLTDALDAALIPGFLSLSPRTGSIYRSAGALTIFALTYLDTKLVRLAWLCGINHVRLERPVAAGTLIDICAAAPPTDAEREIYEQFG